MTVCLWKFLEAAPSFFSPCTCSLKAAGFHGNGSTAHTSTSSDHKTFSLSEATGSWSKERDEGSQGEKQHAWLP